MPLVQVPIPDTVHRLRLTKDPALHLTLEGLAAGQRIAASDAMAAALRKAIPAALQEAATPARAPKRRSGAASPWSSLWSSCRAGDWLGFEAREEAILACDGTDGGQRLAVALRDALRGVTARAGPGMTRSGAEGRDEGRSRARGAW